MQASDKILIDRLTVNKMLNLSKGMSYRKLPRSRFKGKVAMSDVRELVRRSARNGAVWSGGCLMTVDENIVGVSRRTLFRVLRKAPHYRVSRKVALVDVGVLETFVKPNKTRKD